MEKEILKKQVASKKVVFAYSSILFVVVVWVLAPLFTSYVLGFYTPSIYSAVGALVSGVALMIVFFPNLKNITKDYFKIAVPTGFFYSLANLLQKIGLQYTTPTQYAFLENLSCVVVPILLYFFVRKKPTVLTILASLLCLFGCFVLSGIDLSSGGVAFGKGEILCALAGCLYGVNIAATGAYAKRMNVGLYVLVQTWVNAIVSFIIALVLHFVKVGGEPIERIAFSWEIEHLLALTVLALGVSTFCWIIRTNAMKYVSATVVAIMMPFSSVVTGVSSVATGVEQLTVNLMLGGFLVIVAGFLSSADDIFGDRKGRKKQQKSIK